MNAWVFSDRLVKSEISNSQECWFYSDAEDVGKDTGDEGGEADTEDTRWS